MKIHFDPTTANANGGSYLGQYWNNAPDFASATAITTSGTLTNVNATLTTGYVIAGHVLDATTLTPVAGAFVGAQQMLANGWIWGGGAPTASDGSFRVVVPAATYKVSIGGPSSGQLYVSQWFDGQQDPHLAVDISVGPGLPTPDLSAHLVRGYLLTGRIVDGLGNPRTNVSIGANAPLAGGGCCQPVAGTGTDLNGVFRLIAPAGSWLISFGLNAPAPYGPTWWNGATTWQGATPIAFGPGQTLSDLGTVVIP